MPPTITNDECKDVPNDPGSPTWSSSELDRISDPTNHASPRSATTAGFAQTGINVPNQ
jgi:hypothetical protein